MKFLSTAMFVQKARVPVGSCIYADMIWFPLTVIFKRVGYGSL